MTRPTAPQTSPDHARITTVYKDRFRTHGVSPQSLGWTKGKQALRFKTLLQGLSCDGASFLDVGCGFGDLNKTLAMRAQTYDYLGVDMVDDFIEVGRQTYGTDRIQFEKADFFGQDLDRQFDHVLASGIFAFKLEHMENYDYIGQMLSKMLDHCRVSVSVDFLSFYVNFERPGNFYADPATIFEIGMGLTRNAAIFHNYMPFEFSLRLYKDDGYDDKTTVFNRDAFNSIEDGRLSAAQKDRT